MLCTKPFVKYETEYKRKYLKKQKQVTLNYKTTKTTIFRIHKIFK